ncbi:YwmB family TATA-box binding protein [Oceanobacillus massiliensis]|uniref:YwmB family TATA-box binding protein n=1 Tax=Oceanobacillus massiliensis TaxID=1465765 RepID=UPI003018C8C0
MKKTAVIYILLILLTAKPMVNGMERDEMIDLATFTQEQGVAIDHWQVTLKETLDIEKINQIVEDMKNSRLVTMTEDENVIKYLLRDVHKEAAIDVTYSVVIAKADPYQAEMIAVIEGSQWSSQIEDEYLSIKRLIKKEFFTESLKIFACLKTGIGGIMKADDFVERITNYFNLEHIVTQNDTIANSSHEKVIYGYTDLWKQNFIIQGTQMNLQLAVVTDDDKNLTYTIGTPILINEY